MELDELQIGEPAPARAAMRQAVAGALRPGWWWRQELPTPPVASTTRRRGMHPAAIGVDAPSTPATRPSSTIRSTASLDAIQHRDRRGRGARAATSARMIAAPVASPAGVDDAAAAVRRFAAERKRAVGVAVETARRARSGRRCRSAPSRGQQRATVAIAEPGAGRDRVGGMDVRRVVRRRPRRRCRPAPRRSSRPRQSGALVSSDHGLRRQAQRRDQPGDARRRRPARRTQRRRSPERMLRSGHGSLSGRRRACARRRGARDRRSAGSISTSCCHASAAPCRMLASVIRFMCGQRLHGRTNSTSGMLGGDVVAHRALGDHQHAAAAGCSPT